MTDPNEAYCPPTVTAYGSVESITGGLECGNTLDQDFPAGTPFSDLTCS